MKSFVVDRIMAVLFCIFVLVSANAIVADGNGVSSITSTGKLNLRGGIESQQRQKDLGLVSHASTSGRYLEADEEGDVVKQEEDEVVAEATEELENIEREIDGENEDETNELEDIENEFEGEGAAETEVAEENQPPLTPEDATEDIIEEEEQAVEIAEEESPVEAPVEAPTMKPTAKSYVTTNDEFDPIKAEDEKHAEEEEVQELETELKQEEIVARRAGGLGIFLGILAMIFTAHQMSENPDGIYASVCRLAITISSVVVKIVCYPCRKVMGFGGGNPYGGHMPISTSDYNFRNSGFEMS